MAIQQVQYARGLDGKLIAVEQGPYIGWAIGDVVYETKEKANEAAGRLSQQAFLKARIEEAGWGLDNVIRRADPFAEWRGKYDESERGYDLRQDILRSLFPEYGARSEDAEQFAAAFLAADAIYREMKK